jgi:hypothetical protein
MRITALVVVYSCNAWCILAQQTEGIETSLNITWNDNVWIFFVILLNAAYFSRKIILALNGYGISVIDFGKDFVRLREIALKSDTKKKTVFMIINYSVPVALMLAVVICIWARVC